MTSPRLMQIMRDIERKKPEPAAKTQPAGDLGAALESMIQQRVQERVSAELDKHRERLQQHSPRVQQLLRDRPVPSSESPPPAPRTAPSTDLTVQVMRRSEEGRIEVIEIGGRLRMQAQRDALGRITRLVEVP